jgi:peptidoglycan/LPS O-acetylase OafA/YrhL
MLERTLVQTKAPRYIALDSLRGIAAVGVLTTHCLQTVLPEGTLNHSPLRILANGRCFVIFFFVLSGFALANAVWHGGADEYLSYVKRRLARLLPPYIIAGLLGALVAFAITGPDWGALAEYIAALGTTRAIAINPPSWSLVYELRISLLIPFMAFAVARSSTKAAIATIILFVIVELLIKVTHIGQFPYGADNLQAAAIITARFTVCFSAGVLLARDNLQDKRAIQLIAAHPLVALFSSFLLMSVLLDQFSLFGAIILIALTLGWQPMRQFLSQHVLMWLGSISYSLYLTHFILLTSLGHLLHGRLPQILIAALVVPLAIAFAEFFHEFVEQPAITWSRQMKGPSRKAAELG